MCRSERHLKLSDEITIWFLNEMEWSKYDIAKFIGCSRTVVYEKLNKIRSYLQHDAQWFYDKVNNCDSIPTLY